MFTVVCGTAPFETRRLQKILATDLFSIFLAILPYNMATRFMFGSLTSL